MNKKRAVCMLIIVLVFVVVAGSAFFIIEKSITSDTSNAKLFARFFGPQNGTETLAADQDTSLVASVAASVQVGSRTAEAASVSPEDIAALARELEMAKQVLLKLQSKLATAPST